ncbi:riboflavin synthase, partial [bacterium]|nr:riboflavin synthase [bacterium]
MFTGIVEELGRVAGVDDTGGTTRFAIEAAVVGDGLTIGDSIAINGVCLTAVSVGEGRFEVEAVQETLD